MSDLFGNPEDRFSCVAAHIIVDYFTHSEQKLEINVMYCDAKICFPHENLGKLTR